MEQVAGPRRTGTTLPPELRLDSDTERVFAIDRHSKGIDLTDVDDDIQRIAEHEFSSQVVHGRHRDLYEGRETPNPDVEAFLIERKEELLEGSSELQTAIVDSDFSAEQRLQLRGHSEAEQVQPLRIVRGANSERIYALRNYKEMGDHIVNLGDHWDVTDQVTRFIDERIEELYDEFGIKPKDIEHHPTEAAAWFERRSARYVILGVAAARLRGINANLGTVKRTNYDVKELEIAIPDDPDDDLNARKMREVYHHIQSDPDKVKSVEKTDANGMVTSYTKHVTRGGLKIRIHHIPKDIFNAMLDRSDKLPSLGGVEVNVASVGDILSKLDRETLPFLAKAVHEAGRASTVGHEAAGIEMVQAPGTPVPATDTGQGLERGISI